MLVHLRRVGEQHEGHPEVEHNHVDKEHEPGSGPPAQSLAQLKVERIQGRIGMPDPVADSCRPSSASSCFGCLSNVTIKSMESNIGQFAFSYHHR